MSESTPELGTIREATSPAWHRVSLAIECRGYAGAHCPVREEGRTPGSSLRTRNHGLGGATLLQSCAGSLTRPLIAHEQSHVVTTMELEEGSMIEHEHEQRDPRSLIPSLPVPTTPPPEALRGLIALGLDPTEATILLAHQLGFPQNYPAKVSSTRVKTALDKATALGYGRLSRRDLLKRPRPIDEATRQKILEKRNKLLDPDPSPRTADRPLRRSDPMMERLGLIVGSGPDLGRTPR